MASAMACNCQRCKFRAKIGVGGVRRYNQRMMGAQRRSVGQRMVGGALWLLPLSFLAVFYGWPLAQVFHRSLTGLTVGAVWTALTGATLGQVVAFTVGQALLSTALTVAAGLPVAWLVGRYTFPGRGLFRALSGVPFVLPTVVVAAAFGAVLGPQGWLGSWLGDQRYTLTAIVLAHVFYNLTVVVRLVGDFWANLDPQLAAAARTLGASRAGAFWQVTLPLLAPAVLTAAVFVFVFNFTSFGVVLILGGPRFATLEVEIYRQTLQLFNLPLAGLLALVQLGLTLALAVVYVGLTGAVSQPVRRRARAEVQRQLTTLGEQTLATVIIGGVVLFQVVPLAALAWQSVRTADGFSLRYYAALWQDTRQSLFFVPPGVALGRSLWYGLVTAVLSLVLGLPAAAALTSTRRGWRTGLEALLMLPLGTSAVTLGLGFVLAFSQPPLNWRASPWLLPLAHTLVAFPFVVRSLLPALRSIQPQMRQAAAVLGANPWQVWVVVDLPLVGRAALVAAAFAFTLSLGEFGATALLARPDLPTAPTAIYRYLGQPGAINYGQALALSTLLMATCAGVIVTIENLRVGELSEF